MVRSEDAHHAALWTFSRHRVGDYYARVYIPMRNTYRSSEEPTQRIHWTDEWTPPNAINRNRPHRGPWTANEHDLYWTVDQVQIHLQADEDAWAKGEAALYVRLEHSMPNLKALMVRFDGGEWEESKPERIWRLRPGKNGIMAKGINAFDREGHVSRILLRYHP